MSLYIGVRIVGDSLASTLLLSLSLSLLLLLLLLLLILLLLCSLYILSSTVFSLVFTDSTLVKSSLAIKPIFLLDRRLLSRTVALVSFSV